MHGSSVHIPHPCLGAPHSGLGHGGGSVGLEALVGSLVCEQSQGHGVHGRLQPRLLGDLHCVVIGQLQGGQHGTTHLEGWLASHQLRKGHHSLSWGNRETTWSP